MPTLERSNHRVFLTAVIWGSVLLLVAACSGASMPSSTIPAAPDSSTRATSGAHRVSPATSSYTFTTLDDQADPTFNQILGINDSGVIAGYFGIGAPSQPNQGYTLDPPYGQANYMNENFPGAAQTQVTAIDNRGNTAGFWVDANMVNRGFIEWNGAFTSYRDPKTGKGTVNQILGLNDAGIAVGFYNDVSGNSHAFTLNRSTGTFKAVVAPGAVSAVATGINDKGDVVGFFKDSSGRTNGFLKTGAQISEFSFPDGSDTQPLGINKKHQIVGSYLDSGGVMHGFLLSEHLTYATWTSIDDPNGIGSTVVNGLNDRGDLVGFYTDAKGNTNGMLATP